MNVHEYLTAFLVVRNNERIEASGYRHYLKSFYNDRPSAESAQSRHSNILLPYLLNLQVCNTLLHGICPYNSIYLDKHARYEAITTANYCTHHTLIFEGADNN